VTTVVPPGPGAPITGLSHVQLVVSDVAVSARWYRDALGLQPVAEDPDIGYVALRHRGARLVVVLTRAFALPDGDSLDAWAEHLSEIGIDHAGIVVEDGHPSLQLRDPDGVAIELVAP
jgi:glyoxylase I family protein